MFIFLILYFIFLFAYIIFNVYSILRVWSLRLKGDKTQLVILTYLVIMAGLIVVSILLISSLKWDESLTKLFHLGG